MRLSGPPLRLVQLLLVPGVLAVFADVILTLLVTLPLAAAAVLNEPWYLLIGRTKTVLEMRHQKRIQRLPPVIQECHRATLGALALPVLPIRCAQVVISAGMS